MYYERKTSNSPIILFIFFLIIIIGAFVFVKYKNTFLNKENTTQKNELIERKLEYEFNDYVFEISQDNDNFTIVIRQKLECDNNENCIPTRIDTYKVTDEKKKEDLKELFDELFIDKNVKEKQLTRKDVTIDQHSVIESLLREDIEKEELVYKELGPIANCGLKSRGYTITQKEDKYILTISYGEKNTGGYSLEINKIVSNSNALTVIVKENTPDHGSVVTQAFTTPGYQIELNIIPNNISIMNTSNEKYNKIVESTNNDKEDNKEEKDKSLEDNDNYHILDKKNDSSYKQRGFYISKDNKTITIAQGSKNTGGYAITIVKIEYANDEAIIHVKETEPAPTDSVTQAFTNPIAQVEFTKPLNKVTVYDQNNQPLKQIE